jgi:hypothetical protein
VYRNLRRNIFKHLTILNHGSNSTLCTSFFELKNYVLSAQGIYVFRLILDEQSVCPLQNLRNAAWDMLWRRAIVLWSLHRRKEERLLGSVTFFVRRFSLLTRRSWARGFLKNTAIKSSNIALIIFAMEPPSNSCEVATKILYNI